MYPPIPDELKAAANLVTDSLASASTSASLAKLNDAGHAYLLVSVIVMLQCKCKYSSTLHLLLE